MSFTLLAIFAIFYNTDKAYFRQILLDSKTSSGFPSMGVKNCFLFKVKIASFKQLCTPTAGNPGYVLLTSRIRLKYFRQ